MSQQKTPNLSTEHNEYRHFGFVSKFAKLPSIKLLTKVCNRGPRGDNLSLIVYTVDQQLYSCGHNDSGCLGLGSMQSLVKSATRIAPLCGKSLVKICSGFRFVVVLTEDGKCYSWGDNKFGQLGLGKSTASVNKPSPVECLKKEHVIDVSCGHSHVLALGVTGHLYAFGSNVSGAIGNGTTFHQSRAILLTGLAECGSLYADVVAISAGGWHSACVNRKGELFVWGWNQDGQCCHEDVRTNQLAPRRVLIHNLNQSFPCDDSVIKNVQCGLHHTLVLTFDGVVFAFGSNEFGECGQEVATSKCFAQAQLVWFEEPMLEICALAKSRVSMSRSRAHFYVWGQCSQQPNPSMHVPRKIAFSQQIQRDISFNEVLAKHEPSQYNLDVNTLPSQYTEPLLIQNCDCKLRSSGSLNRTFNNPNDSDLVFTFDGPTPSEPIDCRMIFAQKIVLENYGDFLAKFPKEYISKLEVSPEIVNDCPKTPNAKLKVCDDDSADPTTIILTVAGSKKRFHLLPITGVPYETMYAYLFFIYANYLLLTENQLVNLIQLSQQLNNSQLTASCLQHISTHFEVDKLCLLFKCAIDLELAQVEQFCLRQLESLMLASDGAESLEKLYENRHEAGLVLSCTAKSGAESSVRVHKLVLRARTHLYQTLSNVAERSKSHILAEFAVVNQASTMERLLTLDQLNFERHFHEQAVQHYVHFAYHGTCELEHETIEVLVSLLKMAKLFGEQQLESACMERIRDKISLGNVCQFFAQYGHDANNPFVSELCLQVACSDTRALLMSDDLRLLLSQSESSPLQIFLSALSNHLIKLNALK